MASDRSSIQLLSQGSPASSEQMPQSDVTSQDQSRTTSDCWMYTRPRKPHEPEKIGKNRAMYCKLCPEDSPYAGGSTTNFRTHLKRKHNITLEPRVPIVRQHTHQQLEHLHKQYGFPSQELHEKTILRNALNQQMIHECLVTLIVVRNLPFNIAEWPEFHALCLALNSEAGGVVAASHSAIPKLITERYLSYKDVVRRQLQSAISRIHLSLDIWTSPNRQLFLGIVAHYVDCETERLQKALIALRTVVNHSGLEQFNAMLPVLSFYGILSKLGSIISDNASTNDTCCRTMSTYLRDSEGIVWDPIKKRVRCIGHIINLAVQAFLFCSWSQEDLNSVTHDSSHDTMGEAQDEQTSENLSKRATFRKIGAIGKLHNIVVHSRSSTQRTKDFIHYVGRMVPLDNDTRWNSWYQMISVTLQYRDAISLYIRDHIDSLEDDVFSTLDWEVLRQISTFLQPFQRATLETEKDSSTLDSVLFSMDILIKWFEKSLVCII